VIFHQSTNQRLCRLIRLLTARLTLLLLIVAYQFGACQVVCSPSGTTNTPANDHGEDHREKRHAWYEVRDWNAGTHDEDHMHP
jgi:hypothetical protein